MMIYQRLVFQLRRFEALYHFYDLTILFIELLINLFYYILSNIFLEVDRKLFISVS